MHFDSVRWLRSWFALVLSIVWLAGCGGGAGSSTASAGGGTSTGTAKITVKLAVGGSSVTTLPAGQAGVITAVVTDASGQPVSGTPVTFATQDVGSTGSSGSSLISVSPTSALTDATGTATTTAIGQASAGSGVVTVTASATVGTATPSGTVSFNFLPPTPSLSAVMVVIPNNGTTVPAGSTVSVTANVIDTNTKLPFATPLTVNFSSACATAKEATITASALTIGGVATAAYTPQGCTGTDVITASITSLGQVFSLSTNATIGAATPGALTFVSATPSVLGVIGSGNGQTGLVTFNLVDTNGNPVAGQTVQFSLNTTLGGIALTTPSGVTDSSGNVSTQVQSGYIGVPITITATLASNPTINAQSRGMYVSTKLPHQNGFSISASTLNPEFYDFDGNTTNIIVHVSDRFGMPVPDGTAINFRTQGGIGVLRDPTSSTPVGGCLTVASSCTVQLVSSGNRSVLSFKGRMALLAYAVGEDSFVDLNGNGYFDQGDIFPPPGSYNSGEPFIDTSENGIYAGNGEFVDFNNNGVYDGPTTYYAGINCKYANRCASSSSRLVFQNVYIVWSGSFANFTASAATTPNLSNLTNGLITLICGDTIAVNFHIVDENGQILPAGTTIAIATTVGQLAASSTNFTVPNSNVNTTSNPGAVTYTAVLTSGGTVDPTTKACTAPTPNTGALSVTVTTPSQTVSTYNVNILDY
ncbi:MAG: Ig-like domain-containing protein [Burkholderiales bacterium]|nr:Ig-like domain-containing protein [Burkholderiales bacterium]